MLSDLVYGLRSMRRNPGATSVIVTVLALGIGVNTAVFTVLNAVLFRPLPYPVPDRLVTIWAQIPSMNIDGAFVEYNTFADYWRANAKAFESLWASTPLSMNMTSSDQAERLLVMRVSGGFLGMIGVQPKLGRDFLPEDDQPGAPRVVLLSHGLWVRKFGGDSSVLGKSITLDQNNYSIVGVLPEGFDFYSPDFQAYVPIAASTARIAGEPSVGVHGRLKPGVTLAVAQSEIDARCRAWLDHTRYPRDWGARVWRVKDYSVRDTRASLWILAAAVGLILLIACANAANLLLARASVRQREISIRGALGARPGRIVRQLLTENAMLAFAAGSFGLFAAWIATRVLIASQGYLPFQQTISIDRRVLWFAVAAAMVTTILFGLAPALASARSNLVEGLSEGGRGGGEGARRKGLRSALVVAEVGLALVLTILSSLAARSLIRLQAVNAGFNPGGLLTSSVTLPEARYATPQKRIQFFRAALEKLRTYPGVTSASAVSDLPFGGSKSGSDVWPEGMPVQASGQKLIAFTRSIDANYFRVLQTSLLRGRFFDENDAAGPPVAIINQVMARRCWQGKEALGKRFKLGENGQWLTVAGVVADMRQSSLADPPDMEAYFDYAQVPSASMGLVVRTTMDPEHLASALRAAVREIDKELPISDVGTLEGSIAHSTRERRFTVALLGTFSALALILASVGVYGLISFSVSSRTQEIGVRVALGASRRNILAMIIRETMVLGVIGVCIGIAGGFAAARLMRSLLVEVSATDPVVFAGTSAVLLGVIALAGYWPARRAARTNCIVALRHE